MLALGKLVKEPEQVRDNELPVFSFLITFLSDALNQAQEALKKRIAQLNCREQQQNDVINKGNVIGEIKKLVSDSDRSAFCFFHPSYDLEIADQAALPSPPGVVRMRTFTPEINLQAKDGECRYANPKEYHDYFYLFFRPDLSEKQDYRFDMERKGIGITAEELDQICNEQGVSLKEFWGSIVSKLKESQFSDVIRYYDKVLSNDESVPPPGKLGESHIGL